MAWKLVFVSFGNNDQLIDIVLLLAFDNLILLI